MNKVTSLLIAIMMCFGALVSPTPAATPKELEEVQKEKKLRLIQRRIYSANDQYIAMRKAIRAMQSIGFNIEQVYEMKNLVKGIHRDNSHFISALRVRSLPSRPGKIEVWFNLHFSEDPVESPQPYKVFFNTFEKLSKGL